MGLGATWIVSRRVFPVDWPAGVFGGTLDGNRKLVVRPPHQFGVDLRKVFDGHVVNLYDPVAGVKGGLGQVGHGTGKHGIMLLPQPCFPICGQLGGMGTQHTDEELPTRAVGLHHDGKRFFHPWPAHQHGHAFVDIDVAQRDGRDQIAELHHLLAGNLQNLVARAKIGLPSGIAWNHLANHARGLLDPQAKCHHRRQKGEDDVHNHPRRDDGHALGHALGEKTAGIVERGIGDWGLGISGWGLGARGWGLGVRLVLAAFTAGPRAPLRPLHFFLQPGRVVLLAEHLHVPAQRQDADAVLGFAPTELAELQPGNVEAQVELLALHAAELGHDKVAQFVNEDDEPQADRDHENHNARANYVRQRNTSWRAQRSASSTCSRLGSASK